MKSSPDSQYSHADGVRMRRLDRFKAGGLPSALISTVAALSVLLPASASAWTSDDGTAEVNGFVENATYNRESIGITKFRNTLQLEGSKRMGAGGGFDEVTFVGTFRGSYDGVGDLNNHFGEGSGHPVQLESTIFGTSVPHGGGIVLPGGDFNSTNPNAPNYNPNEGLRTLGEDFHGTDDNGVSFAVPVRPCDEDSRGCIDGYMDADSSELESPEFNDRWDFIREAYVDATKYLDNGHTLNLRVGKQQVIWGRTDLLRVLDVINPVDYSRHNIYDELEDIRIPMWIANAEYRMGATDTFDDLNFSLMWNFDEFRPHNLGQGGSPYAILDAGSFFRGMNNCWENGCTVSNFAAGGIATDFPKNVIGIRQAHMPDWSLENTQLGGKVEGQYKDLGFSLNALTYRSQLPSLRGGIEADNPFTAATESQVFPYLIAFDIHFPRVNLVGGSLDYYSESLKSVFRFETAYTSGEEFANSMRPELYSESDVWRYVIGWDRPTFIPFLNENRAFLISAQVFGQHLMDHELENVNGIEVGMPDWETNHIGTLLFKGWYMNDRLSPQIILAHDFRAKATTIAPSIEWLVNDNLKITLAANFKTGRGLDEFDDCRACNPFPPFTGAVGGEGALATRTLDGYEPLGRFRAGPIGAAQEEDEIQLTLRYRF